VSTANRHHTLLRSIFNRAIEWGDYDGSNPLSKIKQEKEPHHRLRFLAKDEIGRLLKACSPRIYPVVVCALMTGLRRGEILNLTWNDVDFEHDVLYILQSKSGKPREVPMSRKLRGVLGQLTPGAKEAKVFKLSEDVLHTEFSRALKIAGIRDFVFHSLRHSFASYFVMRTNDLPSLQKILGHHSPAMTQRYAHLSKGHLQVGMQVFDAGMDPVWAPREFSEESKTSKIVQNQ